MNSIWSDLFVVSVPILEKIIRPILVYVFLVIGLRLAGKRELATLNTFDFVVLLTISNTVQNAIIGADNSLSGGIIGATTLLVVNHLVVRWIHRNRKLEKLAEGKPSTLITRGHIQFRTLQEEDLDMAELEIAAHKQGYLTLSEVSEAILEPDGSISFVGHKQPPSDEIQRNLLERIVSLESKLDQLAAKIGH